VRVAVAKWFALVWRLVVGCSLVDLFAAPVVGQVGGGAHLDPAWDAATLHVPPACALREQFIWTKDNAAALRPEYQATVRETTASRFNVETLGDDDESFA
jgi:hypothetical protein